MAESDVEKHHFEQIKRKKGDALVKPLAESDVERQIDENQNQSNRNQFPQINKQFHSQKITKQPKRFQTQQNSNSSQSQYLNNYDHTLDGHLHEQTWAKANIGKFHKAMEFIMIQCSICQERHASKTKQKNFTNYVCLRCSRDKSFPKKFSK